MGQVLRLAAKVPGLESPSGLTPEAMAGFAESIREGRAPNTVAGLLSYFRAACSYAQKRGFIHASPFSLARGLVRYEPAADRAVHGPAAIGRVLGALGARASEGAIAGRLWAWASVLAHTGVRRDEALFLQLADVDLAAGVIQIRRRLKRPTARRELPIADELATVLAAWLAARPPGSPHLFPNRNGKPWSGGSAGYRPIDRLRRAGLDCQVEGFTPGALRHSFATLCATQWQVPAAILQKWMGHTDIRTTMRYYVHVERKHMAEVARAIRFDAAS